MRKALSIKFSDLPSDYIIVAVSTCSANELITLISTDFLQVLLADLPRTWPVVDSCWFVRIRLLAKLLFAG